MADLDHEVVRRLKDELERKATMSKYSLMDADIRALLASLERRGEALRAWETFWANRSRMEPPLEISRAALEGQP